MADLLGRRADVVSRWVRWGAERRRGDEVFRRDYEGLDEALDEQVNGPRVEQSLDDGLSAAEGVAAT